MLRRPASWGIQQEFSQCCHADGALGRGMETEAVSGKVPHLSSRKSERGSERPDFAPRCKRATEILFHYPECFLYGNVFQMAQEMESCWLVPCFRSLVAFGSVKQLRSWPTKCSSALNSSGLFCAGRRGREVMFHHWMLPVPWQGFWFITKIAGEGPFLPLAAFFFWRYKQLIMTIINTAETRSNPRTLPTKSPFPESHIKIVACSSLKEENKIKWRQLMMSCLNYVNAQVSTGFDLFADVI